MAGFGFNPKGGRLGFRREFGELGASPFPKVKPPIVIGPGIYAITLPDGRIALFTKKTRGGGGTAPDVRSFDVSVSLDTEAPDPESADRIVTVRQGVVNNLMPTNMFSELAVAPTGMWFVVLAISYATTGVVSAELIVTDAQPSPDAVAEEAPPASHDILIAVIHEAVVYQIRRGNINVTTTKAFSVTKEPPIDPGELPYTTYWRLAVTTTG